MGKMDVFEMKFSKVFPLLLAKAERKDIEILQEDGTYKPIDMQRTYSVALTNYNHDAGGFFDCFKTCVVLEESTIRYYEALSNYLRIALNGATGSAYAQPQGRIRIVED